jgi:hypothetical protein
MINEVVFKYSGAALARRVGLAAWGAARMGIVANTHVALYGPIRAHLTKYNFLLY